ncbi:MAG: Mce-associated rane protein [Actinomycetota bacterium]|jgi:Mce-associated membrane protein|nr:Mce-associated rane protein [Actinomycetota bacterium]
MTTPEEPRDATSSPSDTGWPVDAGEPPAPLETSDPTDAEEEGWPAVAEPEPESDPDPDLQPAQQPEIAASDAAVAPAAEFSDVAEWEPEPDLAASDAAVAPAAEFSDVAEWEPEAEPEPEPLLASDPEAVPATEASDASQAWEVAAEPEPEVAAYEPLPTRGGVSAAVIALALTALLMAIANGFVWYRVHQNSAAETARRAGLEASRDAARVLFSYDYRQLDKDFSAGKALTTGKFAKEYAKTTADVVTDIAKEKKAVVKAEVVTAGVVRATPDVVVTIVYVNQVTTSSLQAAPKVDLSRVRMTMTKVGSHWRVSQVDAL